MKFNFSFNIDTRAVIIFVVTLVIVFGVIVSGTVSVKKNFAPGELITAADFNTNFYAIETAINGNAADIAAIQGGTSGVWTKAGSDIYYNSGNVGVGTTSPTSQLVLKGSAGTGAPVTGGGTILAFDNQNDVGNGGSILFGAYPTGVKYFAGIKGYLTNGNVNSIGDLVFYTRTTNTDANLTETMRILSNGNVGIGTTSPVYKLDVTGSLNATSGIYTSNNGVRLIASGGNTVRNAFLFDDYSGSYTHSITSQNGYIKLQGGNNQNIGLNPDGGNVGIGTTSPGSKLTVIGNADIQGNLNISAGSQFNLDGGAATGKTYISQIASDIINFVTNDNEKMRIDSTGNVGIGTTSPGAKLSVDPITDGNPAIEVRHNTAQPFMVFMHGATDGNYPNGTTVLSVGTRGGNSALFGGNVGIGTTSPDVALCVAGSIHYTGSIGLHSDVRMKKEIKELSGVMDKITNLRGVTFKWKKDEFKDKKFDDNKHIGVIAQDVEKYFPEIVETDSKGYKIVDYSKFAPVFIQAFKEQQKEIEEMKKELKELKGR